MIACMIRLERLIMWVGFISQDDMRAGTIIIRIPVIAVGIMGIGRRGVTRVKGG